jgi:hypothetical protein
MSRSAARPGRARAAGAALLGAVLVSGCVDEPTSADVPEPARAVAAATAPAPVPLMTVPVAGTTHAIWPFTGTGLESTGPGSDPINLIFAGHADPRSIRAALLALDGQRPDFPALPFFQCTWDDAMGGNQTGYAAAAGWSGSAIQLECGTYQGLRFHLRLFRAGELTLANAHFETIIPGTHDHQVLNWELAQQLVVADMERTGLLAAAPTETDPINPSPFRTIHPMIYAHPQMVPLHGIINADVVGSSIGIRSSGRAVILELAHNVEAQPGHRRQELVIEFDQMIPKPFCGGPMDYVKVTGPLRLRQDVTVARSGVITRQFHVAGDLTVTPVNPFTQEPVGPPGQGLISGLYKGSVSAHSHATSSLLSQTLLRPGQSSQESQLQLQVGPHGLTRHRLEESCGG